MAIAIDFGTSNTVVARTNPATSQPETLKLPALSAISAQNPPLIPSLLYVENAAQNQVILGQQVRDKGLDLTTDSR
ncbi:Hsp70 family protein, partial [Microcoleus anatoxicus PTRS2]